MLECLLRFCACCAFPYLAGMTSGWPAEHEREFLPRRLPVTV